MRSSWILLEGKPEEIDRIKLCKGRPSWWRQGICSAAERSMCVFPRLSMSFIWSQCFSTCSKATITYKLHTIAELKPSSVHIPLLGQDLLVWDILGHFGTWESWENRMQPTGHDWSIVRSPNLWRIFDPWDLAKQILTEAPCFRHLEMRKKDEKEEKGWSKAWNMKKIWRNSKEIWRNA